MRKTPNYPNPDSDASRLEAPTPLRSSLLPKWDLARRRDKTVNSVLYGLWIQPTNTDRLAISFRYDGLQFSCEQVVSL